MPRRLPDPAPAPLEAFCSSFDDDFRAVNQRNAFRRYLEGLLLPGRAEQNAHRAGQRRADPWESSDRACGGCNGSSRSRVGLWRR